MRRTGEVTATRKPREMARLSSKGRRLVSPGEGERQGGQRWRRGGKSRLFGEDARGNGLFQDELRALSSCARAGEHLQRGKIDERGSLRRGDQTDADAIPQVRGQTRVAAWLAIARRVTVLAVMRFTCGLICFPSLRRWALRRGRPSAGHVLRRGSSHGFLKRGAPAGQPRVEPSPCVTDGP